jgi:hypothetical protein
MYPIAEANHFTKSATLKQPCCHALANFQILHMVFFTFISNMVHIGYFPPREPTNMYHDSYIFKMVAKKLLYNLVIFLNSDNNSILLVWWTLNKSFYKLKTYECHSSINNHWVLLSTCTQYIFMVTWKSRDLKLINSPTLWKTKLQHICNIVECLLNMNKNYLLSNIIIHGVVKCPKMILNNDVILVCK